MFQPINIPEIEESLRQMDRSVADLCTAANIDRSTWTRWKAGTSAPRLGTWMDVIAEFEKMAASPQKASGGAA